MTSADNDRSNPLRPKIELDSYWDHVLSDSTELDLAPEEEGEALAAVSVNWRLLIVSIVVAIAFASAATVWHSRQLKKHSAAFLRQAERAETEEDWAAAADWLGRYLRYVPDGTDRIRRLAAKVLEYASTREQFERALRLYGAYLDMHPEDVAVRVQMAKILLIFHPSRAIDQADRLLEEAPSDVEELRKVPAYVEALRVRAVGRDRVAMRDDSNVGGKLEGVVDAYRKLLECAPDDVENAHRAATFCREHADRISQGMGVLPGQVKEIGDEIMDNLVRQNPKDVNARLARLEYRLRYGTAGTDDGTIQPDEDLQVALSLDQENESVLFAAGAHFAKSQPGDLISLDRLEVARKYLLRAVQAKPEGHRPYLLLGRVAWTLGYLTEAINAIQSGLVENPNHPDLMAALAEFQLGRDDWSQAWTTISALREILATQRRTILTPEQHQAFNVAKAQLQVLRAHWYMASGNPEKDLSEAANIVDQAALQAVPLSGGSKVIQELGLLCVRLGKWEQAVDVFRKATLAAPDAVSPRIRLISTLTRVGRTSEAIEECRQLLTRTLHPNYERRVLYEYARLLLDLELSKAKTEWLWEDFDAALADLKRVAGDEPTVLLLDLDSQYVRGGPESAGTIATVLRAKEAEFGDSEAFWRGAVDFYMRFGLRDDINRAIAKLESLTGAQSARGAQDQIDIETAKQFNDDFRSALRDNRLADAFKILRDWRTKLPTAVQPQVELLKLVAKLAQSDELGFLEEQLAELEGSADTLWRLTRVQRLISQSETDAATVGEAIAFASSWLESEPDLLAARLALGMAHEAGGNLQDAIDAYRDVSRRGQRRVGLTAKVAGLLALEGQYQEARQFLQELTSRQQLSASLLPLSVQMAIKVGSIDEAVQMASRAVDLAPQRAEAHVWLGRALAARDTNNDMRRAEDAFARAVELAPASLSAYVAAIHFHLKSPEPIQTNLLERYARRTAALLQAQECPTEAWRAFVFARCRELDGSLDAAEPFYRWATKSDGSGAIRRWVPPGAIVTFQTSTGTIHMTDPVVWAAGKPTYRTVGLLLGAVGSISDASEDLLDNDPRLRAIVILAQARAESNTEALRLLRGIPNSEVTTGDHMLMADLCRCSGQVGEMAKHFGEALNDRLSARDLQRIAELALRHNAQAEAERAITQLQELQAVEVPLLRIQLRKIVAEKGLDRASKFATGTIDRAANGQARIALSHAAADVLGDAGHVEQAREILESSLRHAPQAVRESVLADWLSMQPGGIDEAIRMCGEMAARGDLRQAALVAVACCQNSSATDEHAAQTEQLVADYFNSSDKVSAQFLVNLSRLKEVQGQIEEAISLAQKAMEIEPNNPTLQNNMAWYLGAYRAEHDKALGYINQAIRILGPLDPLLDTKGIILLAAGRHREAIQLLEIAAANNGASASVYLHLAAAYWAAKRNQDARWAFKTARELGLRFLLPFDVRLADRLANRLASRNSG